ncbi:MAG: RHS repeat-associated core domain-containing protein [Anaerolineales bacterium]|jgi:RHS repeat-associated protein|nr:RHS repeat-associated core domain-containing protein [Anaerolineales bacterium]GER79657.1 conserved hypothetical protein [Candidatus Denitrolinea symbiosum]
MKYPDDEVVTTTYDNNMLPKSVIGNAAYVSNMDYDSAGRLLTRALGNGLTQTYDYYPWNQQGGRLQSLTTGTLQNLAYQYDPVGNITQITNSVAGETSVYDYDALDRLTSWQLNQDTPETYAYDDDTGNLIEKNDLALDYPDASGSQATHPHAVTSAAINDVIVNTYGYDQNGNQTTREIGPDTFELTYDAENRLVEVKKNVTTIAEFTFDGDGARVMSVIGGETIRFVGGYYERKGSEITKYYMAGAARVAMRKYTIPQSMTVEYMLGDHLGSTSVTTDSNGAMVSEMRYKPWGELRYTWTDAPANTSPAYELTRYQYTGQYSYDVEFGLKYYGARFYDSTTGRFAQADTVIPPGTQGYDRYAYSSNDPINNIDPTGHTDIPWWQIIKFLSGQIIENHTITDVDWKTAANTYIPAVNDGSNATVQGSIAGPLAGVLEFNAVTTNEGDFQAYFTYGGGTALGAGVAGGVSQGAINGSGFDNADAFAGQALQLSGGGNLPGVFVGATLDGWIGLTDNQQLSNVYGYDYGATIGTPGLSLALTWQEAVPLGDGFQMNGFGLFVCRVVEQCGSPTILDEEYYYEYE